mmetsp:Transcript_5840/g.8175  ORF Transcript_5840/g.8175 Transcript_5840/m.8175 type:complete len:196 (+) Transcript_5840:229-816(+)
MLESFFEGQKKGSFCGIASAVMISNALGSPRTTQDQAWEYVLTDVLHGHKEDMTYGLTLFQVNKILTDFLELQTTIRSIQDPSELESSLKHDLEQAIYSQSTQKVFIICNFWRFFPHHRGGHMSPIGCYNQHTGHVLMLDVGTHRFKVPYWIHLSELIPLMCKVDRSSNRPRGYILVTIKSPKEAMEEQSNANSS